MKEKKPIEEMTAPELFGLAFDKVKDAAENEINEKIHLARSHGKIQIGRHWMEDGEKDFFVALHDKFKDMEERGCTADEIKTELWDSVFMKNLDDPAKTAFLIAVARDRSWLNAGDGALCGMYAEMCDDMDSIARITYEDRDNSDDWLYGFMTD